MKFLFSALVLMATLLAVGCSTDDTCEGVVTTGDVTVEDVQEDVVESTASDTAATDTVDSTSDVTTVEEED